MSHFAKKRYNRVSRLKTHQDPHIPPLFSNVSRVHLAKVILHRWNPTTEKAVQRDASAKQRSDTSRCAGENLFISLFAPVRKSLVLGNLCKFVPESLNDFLLQGGGGVK